MSPFPNAPHQTITDDGEITGNGSAPSGWKSTFAGQSQADTSMPPLPPGADENQQGNTPADGSHNANSGNGAGGQDAHQPSEQPAAPPNGAGRRVPTSGGDGQQQGGIDVSSRLQNQKLSHRIRKDTDFFSFKEKGWVEFKVVSDETVEVETWDSKKGEWDPKEFEQRWYLHCQATDRSVGQDCLREPGKHFTFDLGGSRTMGAAIDDMLSYYVDLTRGSALDLCDFVWILQIDAVSSQMKAPVIKLTAGHPDLPVMMYQSHLDAGDRIGAP